MLEGKIRTKKKIKKWINREEIVIQEKQKNKTKYVVDLQVKNNSLLTTENGGGIREQRIKDSEITRMNLNPIHDCIFVNVEQWTMSSSINQNPTPRRLCLLLYNCHCPWVCRDDTPIPSHPFALSHSKFQITCSNTKLNSKFNSTPNSISIQFITQLAIFLTPLLHISSTGQLSTRGPPQNIFVSNTTLRN